MVFSRMFTFTTVRSDYDETMQILNEYIKRDRLVIDKFKAGMQDNTHIAEFTVSCEPKDYLDILIELESRWLIIEARNGV